MGQESTDIREAIRTLVGVEELSLFESTICKVSNINLTENTCDCQPVNGDAKFIGVLLSVDNKKGFLLVPKNNSLVAITQLNESDAFISMVSQVDSVLLNGDNYNGLVKVVELTTKLNNLENLVNDLIGKYNAHVHPATLAVSGASATGTTSPTTSTETDTLTPTQQSDIENTTVKQGNNG